MRYSLPSLLLLLGGCALSTNPREPGLLGYLHILEVARDARQACAGLGPDCGPADIASSLAQARDAAPSTLFLPPEEAAAEQQLAQAAFQAAHADCRGRGILPGTPRWDTCRLDRGIARLSEVASLGERR
ncbi:hypothetical protein [Roseomonas chloroacetimidivorans]|jgi:hypothetical protein|uniref:hypothetical protein n=1 Tax=Roseomonas chloroacetimidivorans TaxID=1766656 RepID=UPI003C720299